LECQKQAKAGGNDRAIKAKGLLENGMALTAKRIQGKYSTQESR
jgi:hypothetical protein